MLQLFRKKVFYATLAILVVSAVSLFMFQAQVADAQPGQPINYGDNLQGNVSTPDGQIYTFNGTAGDVAEVQVLGLSGFLPAVSLEDSSGTVLAEEANAAGEATITLTYTLSMDGAYNIRVKGLNNATGAFVVSLLQGTRELPPGIPLENNAVIQGSVNTPDTPTVYDFRTNPQDLTKVEVQSLSGGYNPVVSILNEAGDVIFAVNNPRILAVSVTLGPGDEPFRLVVEQGTYQETANFSVGLNASPSGGPSPDSSGDPSATAEPGDPGSSGSDSGGLGFSSPPAGCAITGNNNINIRQGGSTSHPVIAALPGGRYLQVTGYNGSNGGWYEVEVSPGNYGWMAGSVTQQVGDCSNLPEKTFPPATGGDGGGGDPVQTETPTATEEPTGEETGTPPPTEEGEQTETPPPAQTAEPDGDPVYNLQLNFKQNESRTVSNTISYPNGDTSDRVYYEVQGFDSVTFSATSTFTLVCSGPGAEFARVRVGARGAGQPCNGYVGTYSHGEYTDNQNFTVYLEQGTDAYVTWTAVITASRD